MSQPALAPAMFGEFGVVTLLLEATDAAIDDVDAGAERYVEHLADGLVGAPAETSRRREVLPWSATRHRARRRTGVTVSGNEF